MSRLLRNFFCVFVLVSSCQAVYADAGLPMIIVVMPSMVILLVPIILIEAYILMKQLKLKYNHAITSASLGNIVSTIIGVPITWGILAMIEIWTTGGRWYGDTWLGNFISVTLQAPWMVPVDDPKDYWMLSAAMAFLMIPFFFVSWLIEGFFVKITIEKNLRSKAYRASFYANLASYAFLELCIFVFLIINISQH